MSKLGICYLKIVFGYIKKKMRFFFYRDCNIVRILKNEEFWFGDSVFYVREIFFWGFRVFFRVGYCYYFNCIYII